MITPAEIKEKALKIWQTGRFLAAYLQEEELFPLEITFRKVTGREALESFAGMREWLARLRDGSKERLGYGYSLEFTSVNHRQLGPQLFPSQIRFDTPRDFLRFIGRQKEFEHFQALVKQTLEEQPVLKGWLEQRPLKILENQGVWLQILAVCRFLNGNPMPHRHIRELDIPGVDSKFIEQNKSILRELLDIILSTEAIHGEITTLSGHGFERRFGFKYDEPQIRFRLLDADLAGRWGISDISVPLGQFLTISTPCDRVIITENKINGLSFPPLPQAIVVFGLGYGINTLREVEWFNGKEIFYWGDIDTHGFSILSQFRSYFPHVESFLMDRETLLEFRNLWGREDDAKRCTADLPHLRDHELRLYLHLKNNVLGDNVRLEQERIAFGYLCQRLQTVLGN